MMRWKLIERIRAYGLAMLEGSGAWDRSIVLQ
jgi:hypothetical protein